MLANALDGAAIPYMVIGGQAVLLYGEPRFTRDIDITLGLDAGGVERILALANGLSLRCLVENPTEFVGRTMVLPCLHDASGIRIDFVFSWSAYENEALRRARSVAIEGTPVRYATVEDLVIHKLIAGRPRDLEDVASVLVRQPDLDLAYVRSWLGQFEEALSRPLRPLLESLLFREP
jgi:hypothetical protein